MPRCASRSDQIASLAGIGSSEISVAPDGQRVHLLG